MTARTPNVFIIGAGPVAGALAGALRHAGVPVLGLWARKPEAARAAAAVAGVVAYSAAPPDLLLESDAVLVAVKDESIGSVARMLAGTGLLTKKHVLLHCSGAVSAAEAFGEVASRVGGVGTLHPLRSIVDAKQAALSLRGTVFGIEGDELGHKTALELVRLLAGRPLDLHGEEMALYHAAASMASNYVVALLGAASALLTRAGVAETEALSALLPLTEGTVANLVRVGLPTALTGPIARGDVSTVERHLGALKEHAPAYLELYSVAGRQALVVARAKGEASPESLERIAKMLTEAG
jgi:predicted short-subunit dehydrogenase-like oxidoreductase (DUF2520 family)